MTSGTPTLARALAPDTRHQTRIRETMTKIGVEVRGLERVRHLGDFFTSFQRIIRDIPQQVQLRTS